MKKTILALAVASLLSGCAIMQSTGALDKTPEVTNQMTGVKKEFDTIPAPAVGKPQHLYLTPFSKKSTEVAPAVTLVAVRFPV